MADDRLEKIRQTVKKMVAGGESEEDIDLFCSP